METSQEYPKWKNTLDAQIEDQLVIPTYQLFFSWRILQQSSTKNDQRPVRITDKRCLYAYMRNWSPCVNSAELQEFRDFYVMTQETKKSVVYLKGLDSYSAIRELAPFLPSYYSNKWNLTAGIWFSLSFIRSMHKSPQHWRARGLWNNLKFSNNFPNILVRCLFHFFFHAMDS